MTVRLEDALIEIGDQPIARSPFSKSIQAVVNASINDAQFTINTNQTGGAVLTLLYQYPNKTLSEAILNKNLGNVRDKDYYRFLILGLSLLLASIAIALTIAVLTGNPAADAANATLLGKIIDNFFTLLNNLLGVGPGGASPSSP